MSEAQRFPLAWPKDRPRCRNRQFGRFKKDKSELTVTQAVRRLTEEVERLGGQYAILSTNYRVRMDGGMILNAGKPTDPGVVLFFTMKGKQFTMPCDTYTEVAQNIAALAAHIEATRAIERYGVATASEALQAFTALPPPSSIVTAPPGAALTRPWHEVLSVAPDAADEVVQAAYRALAKAHFANSDKLQELNIARDEAVRVRSL